MKKRVVKTLAVALCVLLGAGPHAALASDRGASKKTTTAALAAKPVSNPKRNPAAGLSRARRQALVGQTSTTLPDGRTLVLGGEGPSGSVASAYVLDAAGGEAAALPAGLREARAWHAATLLPDGKVLVSGGVGADRQALGSAEIFDPETNTSEPLARARLQPRAHHTATLLTDGSVLIVGGTAGARGALATAELWDFRTKTARALRAVPSVARQKHKATLLSDGSVLIEGGLDAQGNEAQSFEVYDAAAGNFHFAGGPPAQDDGGAAFLVASVPTSGSENVPTDSFVGLRFSKPLRAGALNPAAVKLDGPEGTVAARLVQAEGGRLAFVTPQGSLLEGTTYTVSVAGGGEGAAALLPAQVTFMTEGRKESEGQQLSPQDADWTPDPDNFQGNWKSKLPKSKWQDLAPLSDEEGATALAGQALTLGGAPLANVTLSAGDRAARTDDSGRFLLKGVAAGRHVLRIDGRTASKPNKAYGIFHVGVDVKAGRTNVLPFTIWMPRLDTTHAATIASPTTREEILTSPYLPGLELRLPAGTVVRDVDGRPVTQITITPVPTDRPPFPLPPGYDIPVFFTVQPGGARLLPPRARLIYPNYTRQPAGARIDFWNYDPTEKGWYVYGQGTVSPDGRQVIPDPGVSIYEFSGIMISSSGSPPGEGPEEGDNDDDGDPVDLSTGLFVLDRTDLILPDVLPLALTRTYRPRDTSSRAFGIGANHTFGMFLWSNNNYQELDLVLPNGGRIHYVRISPGTGFTDAVYEHTTTPSAFYKSRVFWNNDDGGWNLKLADGTIYVFPDMAPLKAVRDRHGNQITVSRASGNFGNITQVTSPHGRWVKFTYDTSNRVTEARDNIGRVVTYVYDSGGRLWKVTDPAGEVTEYTYDSAHRLLTIKDARGIVFLTNEYDTSGRVTEQTQADGSTYQFAYTVGTGGKITQTDVTDPLGNVRRVTFNSAGYTLTDTFAFGEPEQQTATYERQANTNLLLSETDELGRKTAYAYDAEGRVTSVTRLDGTPGAVTTSFTYSPSCTCGNVASITDPLNHTTTFDYDAKGNLVTITDADSNTVTFAYNALGQVVSVTDQLNHTTQIAYDGGDIVAVTNPKGETTSRFVDAVGRLVSLRRPTGEVVSYEYDVLNQLTKMVDALGGQTVLTYDENGNLLSLRDANSQVTAYTYDDMDRLAGRTDPLSRSESFEYDAGGNLKKFTDRRGKVTTYGYDNLERNTFIGFGTVGSGSGATYESTITYSYDDASRMTQAVDSVSGTITLGYDALDRLTSEATPQGSISYAYDAASRRTSMTVAGQTAVNYTYDDLDRLTAVTRGTAGVSIGYDAASRRTSLTLPNGVVAQYGYDDASQLTGITFQLGSNVLGDLTYEYDGAGRRTKVGGSYARTNLPAALSSATYDAANQMTARGAASLTYDANGNQTSDGTNTYTWDARNQLVSVSGGASASFQYDAFRRRVRKTVGGVRTDYLFDGDNAIQEQSGGSATANLLTALWADEVFARTDAAGTQTLLNDALGSTLALLDSAGAAQTVYTYEPFGRATSSGSASSNPSQFTGRDNDGTGLYYYRARYYNAVHQRFISEDPLEFAAGDTNLYAYVYNSPLNYTDPTGMNPWAAACLGGAAMSLGLDLLSGRKMSLGDALGSAAGGCVMGLAGLGLGRALGAAARGLRGARGGRPGLGSPGGPKPGQAGGPGAGKPFPNGVKDTAREQAGNRCVFCQNPTTRTPGPRQSNIDHSIPKSRGGNNTIDNAQNTCRTCNLEKGTRTTQEYLDWLRSQGRR